MFLQRVLKSLLENNSIQKKQTKLNVYRKQAHVLTEGSFFKQLYYRVEKTIANDNQPKSF